jgi:hypothetical protein
MTEVVFLAGMAVLLLAVLRFRATQNRWFLLLGVLASWWMSLTRYDGWFLIPFAGLWFGLSARRSRWRTLAVFGALAGLAPVYWLAHNRWETGDALDFFNGPYSALAIQGGKPYPGYHDWLLAGGYYAKAGQLCAGWCLVVLGAAGAACALLGKRALPVLFLLLTPLFYIWSIHSSGTPIFLPQLASRGYYNTRYGIAVIPLAAFAAGAIVPALPARCVKIAYLIPVLSIAPWVLPLSRQNWICWKESEVNSVSRRAWTQAATDYFNANYQLGQGIIAPFGDLTGIFCRARIPLAEVLHEGNGPPWLATITRPDLIHREMWAVTQANQFESQFLSRKGSPYYLIKEIRVEGAPPLHILRRSTP